MKVDLQLSAFPVYNQQANLELSSGGSALRFRQCDLHPRPRDGCGRAAGNLDEFTSDPKLTAGRLGSRYELRRRSAGSLYRNAKVQYLRLSWEGGAW